MLSPATQQHRLALARECYERYGRPLENAHQGEYLAVSEGGETLLAPTLDEAMERAEATFGPGGYVFKIGEVAVGRCR